MSERQGEQTSSAVSARESGEGGLPLWGGDSGGREVRGGEPGAEGARSSGVYGAFRALPWETGTRCGRARSRGADASGATAGVRVRVAKGTAGAVREEVRILLSRHKHGCRTGSRTRGAEPLASAVTMSANPVPRDSFKRATVRAVAIFPLCVLLPPVPSCAKRGLPAARAVTAAARSPTLQPAAVSHRRAQLDARARVCVSKRISSPSSLRLAGGTRSRATSCRVAASPHPPGSLPTHPAPSPPCAPLLPLLLLQWPLLSSLGRRKDLEKRKEKEKGGGKESRYL